MLLYDEVASRIAFITKSLTHPSRSVNRLSRRSVSSLPSVSRCPLSPNVLERQNLDLVVSEEGLLVVLGPGEALMHLEVVFFDTSL